MYVTQILAALPIPPSQDPFYTAPHGFEKTAPGTILRIRHAPGNATNVIANASAVYHIVYRTTDSNYKPAFAVTTLFIPFENATLGTNSSQTSLLSIQIPYNSVWVDASPSFAIYYEFAQPAFESGSTNDDTSYALGKGWFVNMPDHEGPTASFAMGITEGHATLDSIRAVLSSGLLPDYTQTKYAMWGYSGGSIASEWASELQEQYAPELSFAGMAIGGCVPNLTEARDNLTGSAYAGLLPGLYLGLTSQDEEARAYLVSRLKKSGPYNATTFLADLHLTVNQAFATYANQDLYDYFINGRADLLAPILTKIADRNSYQGYHGVPKMPTFVYKAIGDEFSTVKSTDALVERWCSINVDVEYQRNTVGNHITEISNGKQRALDWLGSIFDGTATIGGCSVKNVSVNVVSSVS
ncbi:LIP-domain-containing protein [Paraphaeosphaeria sporulosa]|uniref:LIP-domain-containing protein n=1 Tax=Paraphaeosphaeria sporulosa TaxID=1460663 RepID=A0A177C0V0_9PLEO|nr:LIP-domain-containing protein [Paraphaeosphaeria sporulosa]OAG01115.1 LIP-domain-containing protein [Paraphaeosphaeria sporulosa]